MHFHFDFFVKYHKKLKICNFNFQAKKLFKKLKQRKKNPKNPSLTCFIHNYITHQFIKSLKYPVYSQNNIFFFTEKKSFKIIETDIGFYEPTGYIH